MMKDENGETTRSGKKIISKLFDYSQLMEEWKEIELFIKNNEEVSLELKKRQHRQQ